MKRERFEVFRGSGNVHCDLGRFTVDRLMSVINRLGSRVEVAVKVKRSVAIQHVAMS